MLSRHHDVRGARINYIRQTFGDQDQLYVIEGWIVGRRKQSEHILLLGYGPFPHHARSLAFSGLVQPCRYSTGSSTGCAPPCSTPNQNPVWTFSGSSQPKPLRPDTSTRFLGSTLGNFDAMYGSNKFVFKVNPDSRAKSPFDLVCKMPFLHHSNKFPSPTQCPSCWPSHSTSFQFFGSLSFKRYCFSPFSVLWQQTQYFVFFKMPLWSFSDWS